MTNFTEMGTFTHEGKDFTFCGAMIQGDRAVGYLKTVDRRLTLITWKGEFMGYARIVATWRTRGSFASEMHQVEVVAQGRTYTGRSAGEGTIWTGKAKR